MATNDQTDGVSTGTPAGTPTGVPTELSKDDLLKYIELDLWGRFQERLWKVVGIVLTIATIVGILGIPYYIKSEVQNTLQTQATEFKQRTEAILSQAKLLAVLTAQYNSERYRLDMDVYRLVDAIKKARVESGKEQPGYRFHDPQDELNQLASREDFSKVVDKSYLMGKEVFSVPEDLKGKELLPPTTHIVENRGIMGSGGYMEVHPVRNGTYEGAIKDIRFRIVTLEALRRAIALEQERLLALGGATELDRRVETIRVKSLEATEFSDSLIKEITTLANGFLSDEEQREFARVQSLYLDGDLPKYQAPTPAPQGAHDKAAETSRR